MDPYIFIITICIVVILSYFFNIINRKFNIPSILLLILTGITIHYLLKYYSVYYVLPVNLLSIIGAFGLILIVLEASLELELVREKRKLISKAFLSSMFQILLSLFVIGTLLFYLTGADFKKSLINAIPLSVISSAIAISGIHTLNEVKKEFITYEATFSDILGILVFNFVVIYNITNLLNISGFLLSILITIIFSILISFALIFILNKIKLNAKIIFLLSILILLYSTGEFLHLSSLILVLIFGLIINNHHYITKRYDKYFEIDNLDDDIKIFKTITKELSFLMRTIFFTLFGYSMRLSLLADNNTLVIGASILVTIYFLRFLYLKIVIKSHLFPEIFIAPRGLITMVLYYSIPSYYRIDQVKDGVLIFVIIATSLLMMLGLLLTKPETIKEFS